MEPLVSVVIPTYGRPTLLPDAVRSVVDQGYEPIELIIIDDCSHEPVKPVIDQIDTQGLHRVEVIRHEQNQGANAARNTGIETATGDIIAFLDDDDRWEPNTVQRYVEAFETGGPDVGLVTVGIRVVDESGTQIATIRPTIDKDPLDELLDGTLIGSFSRFAVRSDVVEIVGSLDERLPCWQDWEWQFRLAHHIDFVGVPELLVQRTHGSHSQITDTFEQRREVAYPIMLERHRDAIAKARGPRGERQFIAALSRSLASSALSNGRYLDAVRCSLKSLRYDPLDTKTYLYLGLACGGPITFRTAQKLKWRFSRMS